MTDATDPVLLSPIGYVRCDRKYRYETARQGVLAQDSVAVIELFPRQNFEQALKDILDFERLWIIYLFHLNRNWKPLVNVPRHRRDKVGVFATRAPYRPNPIGISCVRLLGIDGLRLTIGDVDILDATPVLDIKPYLPYADSFPEARTGWVGDACAECYAIEFSSGAEARMTWILQHAAINLAGFIEVQLQHFPTDMLRKRIAGSVEKGEYILSYRTWRIHYVVREADKIVFVTAVRSGYSPDELEDVDNDTYFDKRIHRRFVDSFNNIHTPLVEPDVSV
jgi:tRNA (adenine37-N6)-methyltransferase